MDNVLRRFLGRFRQTLSRYWKPKDIPGILEQVAAKYPTKDAVVCDDVRLTFSQLKEQATRLANGLSALGVTQGDWVAIMLPNCPEFVSSFLAIAKIGAVVVPADIYYQQPELERMLRDGHISTLITNPEFLDIVEPAVRKCPGFKNLILKGKTEGYPSLESMLNTEAEVERTTPKIRSKDDLLYLYTSGTTGTPKGVTLSHAKVIAIGRAWRKGFSLADDDKCYTLAPLFRSPALLSVVVAGLCYGITMVIPSTFRPHQVWEQIASENISFFHACPFHFAVLANLPPPPNPSLPALKSCYSSGNRLPPWVVETFLDQFDIRIDERYGTLEAGGICENGFPLIGVRIKLINRKGKRIRGKGRIGEIVVKTSAMAKEYHNLPELSHQAFRGGWFHTGDLGKIDQEGRLRILCRKKTAFLIDGKEVYADEVERVLRRHPQVAEAKVVRDEPKPGNAILKAIVVLKEPCSQDELLEFCRSRLAAYKVPQQIKVQEELPRSWKAVVAGMEQAYPKWGEF